MRNCCSIVSKVSIGFSATRARWVVATSTPLSTLAPFWVIGATDSIIAAAHGRRRSTCSSGTPSRSSTGRRVARAVGESFSVRERSGSTP